VRLTADSRTEIRRAIDQRTRNLIAASPARKTHGGGGIADYAIEQAGGDFLLALDIAVTARATLQALSAEQQTDTPQAA
jgi:hypothetical protein